MRRWPWTTAAQAELVPSERADVGQVADGMDLAGAGQSLWMLLPLVATFAVVQRWLLRYVPLDEAAYRAPVVFLEELQHPATAAWYAGCLGGAIWAGRRFGWDSWEGGPAVRRFITLLAAICGWATACYDINFYFDQIHAVDRVLVLALVVGVWVHPLWVGPFLAHSLTMAHQFAFPLHAFPWTDKELPFSILMMFVSLMTVSLWRRQTLSRFVLLSLCVVGANYFWAGAGKVAIGWLWREDLSDLFVNSYMNGWAQWWSEAQIDWLADAMVRFNGPMMAFTLATELGAVLLPWRRNVAVAVLTACALLHLGIFAFSGICFWKWLVVDAAFALLLWRGRPEFLQQVFQAPRAQWICVGLIVTFPVFSRDLSLAWYDTELTHQFDMEVVGTSGRRYPLRRDFFSPYDFTFCQNRFAYLSQQPVAVGTYGTTLNAALPETAAALQTQRDLQQLLAGHGSVQYDGHKRETLRTFLATFLRNFCDSERDCSSSWVPHHIWMTGSGPWYEGQEPVRSVRIVRRDRAWDESAGRVLLLQEEMVAEWPLEMVSSR